MLNYVRRLLVVIIIFLFFGIFFYYYIIVVLLWWWLSSEQSGHVNPSPQFEAIPAAASSSVRISYRNAGAIQALLHKDTTQTKPELIASRHDENAAQSFQFFATNFDTASYRATYPQRKRKGCLRLLYACI